jgi:hypothetical protein
MAFGALSWLRPGARVRRFSSGWDIFDTEYFMADFFSFFGFVISLGISIFFIAVAWRLMRANERTADAVERIARKHGDGGDINSNQNS